MSFVGAMIKGLCWLCQRTRVGNRSPLWYCIEEPYLVEKICVVQDMETCLIGHVSGASEVVKSLGV